MAHAEPKKLSAKDPITPVLPLLATDLIHIARPGVGSFKITRAELETELGIGADTDAIHDNVAAEITAIAEKVSPVGPDVLIIEDSEAAGVKKKLQVSNLPGEPDATESAKGIVELATDGESASGVVVQGDDARLSDDRNDADAIHDNIAAEISAIAEKVSPIGADFLLLEDSADSNNKKRIQVSSLPGAGFPLFTNTAYQDPVLGTSDGGASLIFDTIANALIHINATTPTTINRWQVIVYGETDPGSFAVNNFVNFIAVTVCAISGPVTWAADALNFSTIFFQDVPIMKGFIFNGQVTQTVPAGSGGSLINCSVLGGWSQAANAIIELENCTLAHVGVGTWQFASVRMRDGQFGSAAGTMPINLVTGSSQFAGPSLFGNVDFFTTSGSVFFEKCKSVSGLIRARDQASNVVGLFFTDCDIITIELFRGGNLEVLGTSVGTLTIDSSYLGIITVNTGCKFNTVADSVVGGASIDFNGHVFPFDSEVELINTTSTVRGSSEGAVLNILGSPDSAKLWDSMTIVQSAADGTEITINRSGIYAINFPIETEVSADFHAMLTVNSQLAPASTAAASSVLDAIFKPSNATITFQNLSFYGRLESGAVVRVNVIDAAGEEPDSAGPFTIRRIA